MSRRNSSASALVDAPDDFAPGVDVDVLGSVDVAVLRRKVLREKPCGCPPIRGRRIVDLGFEPAELRFARLGEVFIKLWDLPAPLQKRVLADAYRCRRTVRADASANEFDKTFVDLRRVPRWGAALHHGFTSSPFSRWVQVGVESR